VPFDAERMQTPHVCLAIFARGLLNHLTTRLYFGDEPDNGADPVLQQVPRERQATLVARRSETGDMPVYTLDIVLQGERETVFFNL
jgi:protocatechuate 3,4-dioxygenase alpha subunit